MKIKSRLNILIMSSCVIFSAQAATIECPKTIKTNQSLQGKIANWEAFIDDSNDIHNFARVTFYSQHPKGHASLTPDNTKNTKATWNFNGSEIWLACEYTNTRVQLIQKLPNTIKNCTATYNSSFSEVTGLECNS
jgi:hypothetical protein